MSYDVKTSAVAALAEAATQVKPEILPEFGAPDTVEALRERLEDLWERAAILIANAQATDYRYPERFIWETLERLNIFPMSHGISLPTGVPVGHMHGDYSQAGIPLRPLIWNGQDWVNYLQEIAPGGSMLDIILAPFIVNQSVINAGNQALVDELRDELRDGASESRDTFAELSAAIDAVSAALVAAFEDAEFTGTPLAPTADPGTNTTQVATTAFVHAALAALIASAPGALDTLNELAAALGDDENFAATMTTALAGKQATLTAPGDVPGLTAALAAKVNAAGGDGSAVLAMGEGGTESRSLAAWFEGIERGTIIPPASAGYFTDRATAGEFGKPMRLRHRLLLGDAADDGGETVAGDETSWLTDQLDHYFVRSGFVVSISPNGGAGGVFATRTSDKYDGESVWAAGQTITAGDKRGYNGRLYTATTSGTTGATPPTHTTGTASDGGVTWQFTQFQNRTPMASARVLLNDLAQDGAGSWADYVEAIRGAGAGTTYGREIVSKNKGTDVVNDPYNKAPGGSTFGDWFAAGGDPAYGGSAANPSTAAILIGALSHTWNKGIVFEELGLTDLGGGVRIPIAMAQKHRLRWYAAAGAIGADLYSEVTAANERTALAFANRIVQIKSQDALIGTFESAPAAGTPADNYIALLARSAASGYVEMLARGSSTDIDLLLSPKGAGRVRVETDLMVKGKAIWRTIAASAVAITRNSANDAGDATETAQVTIPIPAAAMGANGLLRVTLLVSQTNSANVKTWRAKFGASGAGVAGAAFYNVAATSQASGQIQLLIRNRNNVSQQIGHTSAVAAAFGQSTGAVATAGVNTAAASEIVISNLWAGATSGETMTVEAYHVEVMHQS